LSPRNLKNTHVNGKTLNLYQTINDKSSNRNAQGTVSPYQRNVEEFLQEVKDSNKNKALQNRILSPLRIISPGRNLRNEPNLKSAHNANPITRDKDMKRVTSAKNIEVRAAINNYGNAAMGGTMNRFRHNPNLNAQKLDNLFLKNNAQYRIDINENSKKSN